MKIREKGVPLYSRKLKTKGTPQIYVTTEHVIESDKMYTKKHKKQLHWHNMVGIFVPLGSKSCSDLSFDLLVNML